MKLYFINARKDESRPPRIKNGFRLDSNRFICAVVRNVDGYKRIARYNLTSVTKVLLFQHPRKRRKQQQQNCQLTTVLGGVTNRGSGVTNHGSGVTNHGSGVTNHGSDWRKDVVIDNFRK